MPRTWTRCPTLTLTPTLAWNININININIDINININVHARGIQTGPHWIKRNLLSN